MLWYPVLQAFLRERFIFYSFRRFQDYFFLWQMWEGEVLKVSLLPLSRRWEVFLGSIGFLGVCVEPRIGWWKSSILDTISRCLLLLSFCTLTLCWPAEVHISRTESGRGLVLGGERAAQDLVGNEGSDSSLECFPRQDHGRVSRLLDWQRHHCGVLGEARGHSLKGLCDLTQEVVLWSEVHLVTVTVRYIPQKNSILVDQLSRPDQVLPTEWFLLTRVFEMIYKVFSRPHINLFAMRANTKLPLDMSPVQDPMAWKQDASQHPWDDLSPTPFSPSLFFIRYYRECCFQQGCHLLVTLFWPQKEWFPDLLAILMEEPLKLSMLWNLLVQPHIRKFHCGLKIFCLHSWKPSSVSSKRLAFWARLWRLLLLISGVPQQHSTRKNGLDSSIGVVDRISLHARPLHMHGHCSADSGILLPSAQGVEAVDSCGEGLSCCP